MSAAPDQQPPVKGPGGGTPPRKDETDLWMLVHEHGVRPRDGARLMGMNHKRLQFLCYKWSAQGKYDYGVTHDLGWSERRFRGPQIMASRLDEASRMVVYPKPPPPPFSGASLAMRVVMAGRDTNPALREANRRAVRSVARRARQDAARIVGGVPSPRGHVTRDRLVAGSITARTIHTERVDLFPRSHWEQLADGSVRRRAVPHLVMHTDGSVETVAMVRTPIMQLLMEQPMPTARRGEITYRQTLGDRAYTGRVGW